MSSLRTRLREDKHFGLATLLVREERFRESLDHFNELLVKNDRYLPDILHFLYRQYAKTPTRFALGVLIAEIYLQTRHYQEAFQEVQTIFEQDPHFSPIYLVLGKLYKRSLMKEDVRTIFEAAFLKNIFDSTILDLLPTIYLEERNYDKGISFYETLISHRPDVMHLRKNLAGFYARVGRYGEAVTLYENLVEYSPSCLSQAAEFCESVCLKAPDMPKVHEVLVGLYTKSCNPAGALKHLRCMVELQPDFVPQAVQSCKELLALYPDTVDVLLELAGFLIHLDRFSEGVACLRQIFEIGRENEDMIRLLDLVLERFPSQIMALHLKAEIQFSKRDYAQVLLLIEQILQVSEYDMDFYQLEQLLTSVMLQDSFWAPRARLLFARALLMHKDYVRADLECRRLWGGQLDESARALAIEALRGMGREQEAFRLAFQTLDKYPYQADVHHQLKLLHATRSGHRWDRFSQDEAKHALFLGMVKLQNLDFSSAMRFFQRVDGTHKDYVTAQFLLNRCFFEMGRFDLSISLLSRLLADTSLEVALANQVRFFLGISYLYMGLVKEALTYFESILEFDVSFPYLDSVISRLKSEGLTDFRGKVLAATFLHESDHLSVLPVFSLEVGVLSFAHTHNNQGIEHVIKGHSKAAKDAFEMAIQMDPEFWIGYVNLGMLFFIQGDFDSAEAQFLKVSEICPDLDVSFLNLGVLQWRLGRKEDAFSNLMKAHSVGKREVTQLVLGDYFASCGQYRDAFSFWDEASKSVWMSGHLHRRLWYLCPPDLPASEWISVFNRVPSEYLKLHACVTKSYSDYFSV